MKKLFIVLLLAGAASHYHVYAQPFFVPNATPVSQTVFSPTEPGRQQINFLVWLPEKNRIWFDMAMMSHLALLPDLDSLFGETAKLLHPLMDSFKADGWLRRIEVDVTQKPAIFRVITYANNPKAFTSIEDELVQVKMDQDTIRIKVINEKSAISFINLLVNNIADLENFSPDAGKRSLSLINEGVEKNYKTPIRHNPRHKYYGVFNLETGQLVSPDSKNYHAIRSGGDQVEITLLKPSLSYARGSAFTGLSFGAAFNYYKSSEANGVRLGIGVYWEPQFSFRNETSGKVQTYRDDFLTLKLEETPNKPHSNFGVLSAISIGYLVNSSGNYFEKNTFRIGVAGVAAGRLQLEPEFYFNDFFKNISPGIRLSMKIL